MQCASTWRVRSYKHRRDQWTSIKQKLSHVFLRATCVTRDESKVISAPRIPFQLADTRVISRCARASRSCRSVAWTVAVVLEVGRPLAGSRHRGPTTDVTLTTDRRYRSTERCR